MLNMILLVCLFISVMAPFQIVGLGILIFFLLFTVKLF